jgi:hypothetical protein
VAGEAAGRSLRTTARRLIGIITADDPTLLVYAGVDLSPAIEQAFFLRMRRPKRTPRAPTVRSFARVVRHMGGSLRGTADPRPGDVVALVVNPAQARIFEPVAGELRARGLETFTAYESHARSARTGSASTRLVDRVRPDIAARLFTFETRVRARVSTATRGFEDVVDAEVAHRMRRTVIEIIGRAALYAAAIDDLAVHRPALLVGFNEVGRWARILPAVARKRGIPSLDVAHAEAVDVAAIEGAGYDRFAVFGPRSADVLARAGVDPARIEITGAPRFDALIRRHGEPTAPPAKRRVVFASQWLGGAMSAEVKERTADAALSVAGALAPCELVIQRHPIEWDDIAVAAASRAPEGVTTRIGPTGGLHDELDGAWLLVTGWSNSVFEAALSNVPAIAVNATGGPSPNSLAEDPLALGAVDAESAAAAARTLRTDDAWLAAVRRARAALGNHLGPLDGRAAERVADVAESMIRAGS